VRRRGDVLRVVVADTGVGIPPDRQVEIFQEFRRLEADAEQRDGWQEEAGPTTAPGALLLVIENERAIRDGMQALLEGWGYRVLTAASVEGGLAALRHGRQRPDAVIADYHLDEGTGTEAIAHLRDRFGAAIPAMVITADRMPEVEREIHALRLPLLNKPIRPAQLRACLRHLLEGAA
jgi:CheY-like chemotaxis protein